MPLQKQILSTHLFLFPFRWDIVEPKKNLKESSYDDRTRLFSSDESNSFEKLLLSAQSSWKHKPFTTQNSHIDYNQYHYFYEFVRPALFDNSLIKNKENPILRTYHFEEEKNLRFEIEINVGSEEVEKLVTHNLKIDSIQLNAYDVGVGILSFHMSTDSVTFERKQNFGSKDVLLINDFGRRLYPQFLGNNFNIKNTQAAFLAKRITILSKDEILIHEDFTNFNNQTTDFLPAHIIEILGKKHFTNILDENKIPENPQIKIQPLIDDRMFVLSILADNSEIRNIKNYSNNKAYLYSHKFDFWQKFVFVDGKSPSSPDFHFAKEILSKATYTRWLPYSTLFGISRYSFVMLCSTGEFYDEILKPHLQTMYFQMIQLALLQRATVLRFSSEITRISHEIDAYEQENKGFDKITDEVRIIYKNYIQFRNQLHFREVTAQEQGIELYDMIQNTMRIETHIKELDAEIDELHRYVKLVNDNISSKRQEEETQNINRLTKMAGVFGVISLIFSYFGYGLIQFPKVGELSPEQTWIIFIGIVTALALTIFYFFQRSEKEGKLKNIIQVLIVIFGVSLIGFPLFFLKSSVAKDSPKVDSLLKTNNKVYLKKIDSLNSELKQIKKLVTQPQQDTTKR
jgi:cell division protein FtsB